MQAGKSVVRCHPLEKIAPWFSPFRGVFLTDGPDVHHCSAQLSIRESRTGVRKAGHGKAAEVKLKLG